MGRRLSIVANSAVEDARSPLGNAVMSRVVEELARDDPKGHWVTIPRDPDLQKGWRDLTYRELADSVNGLAAWVDAELQLKLGDVVAYIG